MEIRLSTDIPINIDSDYYRRLQRQAYRKWQLWPLAVFKYLLNLYSFVLKVLLDCWLLLSMFTVHLYAAGNLDNISWMPQDVVAYLNTFWQLSWVIVSISVSAAVLGNRKFLPVNPFEEEIIRNLIEKYEFTSGNGWIFINQDGEAIHHPPESGNHMTVIKYRNMEFVSICSLGIARKAKSDKP
jgi:hypothetical protein